MGTHDSSFPTGLGMCQDGRVRGVGGSGACFFLALVIFTHPCSGLGLVSWRHPLHHRLHVRRVFGLFGVGPANGRRPCWAGLGLWVWLVLDDRGDLAAALGLL